MRAIILAGGKGTRLRPYTNTLPKPLVPVGDRAILEVVLSQLKQAGVQRVTLAVNHLAHLIMAYFGDGSRWGLSIDYSLEDQPLGTIAPLKLIGDLPETFFVMNGDILTDLDYRQLFEDHQASGADITVATFERTEKVDFGVLQTSPDHCIVAFEEKPNYHFKVSMGIYIINRALLEIVPDGRPYGFDNLMLDCISVGRKTVSWPHKGFWLDIGRPSDYQEANECIERLLGPGPGKGTNGHD